jgi:hypothetical protein
MRSAFVWVFVGLVGCTKVGASQDPSEPPDEQQQFAQPPGAKMPPPSTGTPPKTAATKVTILMTSATLADDCGTPPPAKAKSATWAKDEVAAKADMDDTSRKAKRKRSCEQSSMQLSVKSDATGGAATLAVKKVELFDDQGKLLGELTPRDPGVWAPDGSSYNAWDQRVAPGTELSVSYALSQPPWGTVTERWNRTYVLKAVVTVGGTDQAVQHEVHIEAPTFLPPNVKT